MRVVQFLVAGFVMSSIAAAADPPAGRPEPIYYQHCMGADAADGWVVYAWTNGKSGSPGFGVGVTVRVMSDMYDKIQDSDLMVTVERLGAPKDEVPEAPLLSVKPNWRVVNDGFPYIWEWSDENLFPDPKFPKTGVLKRLGRYTLRLELKVKGDPRVAGDRTTTLKTEHKGLSIIRLREAPPGPDPK